MHEVPEAKPAILLAWADNSDDLAAIKAAGQVPPNPPSMNNLPPLSPRHLQTTASPSVWSMPKISGKMLLHLQFTGHC